MAEQNYNGNYNQSYLNRLTYDENGIQSNTQDVIQRAPWNQNRRLALELPRRILSWGQIRRNAYITSSYRLPAIASTQPLATPSTSASVRQQTGEGNSMFIRIVNSSNDFNDRFQIESRIFTFKFREYNGQMPFEDFLINGFNEILNHASRDIQPHFLVGIKIAPVSGENIDPAGLSFRRMSELSAEMIHDLLFSVAQSNSAFSVTEMLEITVNVVKTPYGGAPSIRYKTDLEILRIKKRCIADPGLSDDLLCFPKSLLLGKAIADGNVAIINSLLYNYHKLTSEASKLLAKAKVDITPGRGCNMIDIFKFQKFFQGYSIVIHDDKSSGNNIFCKTQNDGNPINIFYFKDSEHFVALRKRKSFFGMPFECPNCLFLHRDQREHKCSRLCASCKTLGFCRPEQSATCNLCNRIFNNPTCFNNHLTTMIGEQNVCSVIYSCRLCSKTIDMRSRRNVIHTCGEFYCKICMRIVASTHLCYIQPHTKRTPSEFMIIFFDIECRQDIHVGNSHYKHTPNLCVSQQVCDKCFMIDRSENMCENCGQRKHVFKNSDRANCLKKFINYIDDFSDQKVLCVAHNLKGYDGQLILSELANRKHEVTPTMIGCKLLRLSYKRVTFIDSFSFLTMPLSQFPKAFDLVGIAKGYYPHFFNTFENENYIGPIPDKRFFGIDGFSTSDLELFNVWYREQEGLNITDYNNDQELQKYCEMDVEILRKGCIKFMTLFKAVLDINPFLESTTLPSAVMLGFRKKFLKPYTLGIVPQNQYSGKKNSSFISRKWIEYESSKLQRRLIVEYKTPRGGLYVDAFDPVTNVVYEFLGDWYHGCKKCFKYRPESTNVNQFDNTPLNKSLDQKYEDTMMRMKRLNDLGYTICSIWECEFKSFLKSNPAIDTALNNSPAILHGPINCRDAIYGGLTDVFRTFYEVKPGEKILALDFKSLYPTVNKNCRYPINHPTILRGEQCRGVDISNIHGIIKCKILPPQNLFHPVLPCKSNDRLVTANCCTCMENYSTNCSHSEEERALVGTWVLAEVNYAIECGYILKDVYEIWQYNTEVYDPVTKTGGIFTEYMNLFIKMKEQASNWPRENMTAEEKESYISGFFETEGVLLEHDLMETNGPMRSTSKLCLNSLWGKFIEWEMRTQVTVFRKPHDFFNHIASPGVEIVDVLPYGEKSVWVKWKFMGCEYAEPLKHQCLPIGAFTTAYARIKLHREVLALLQSLSLESNVAIYCDTDSIYFILRPGRIINLPIGDAFGQLTNELLKYGRNAYIIKFVAIAPKSYSYVVYDPDTNTFTEVSKCKGISSTAKNGEILTFENLKSLVFDPNVQKIVFRNEKKIKRTKTFDIVSGPEVKNIKFTHNKRICLPNNMTVPYGYKPL